MSAKIVPVLLAGGAGSRLWPLSRQAFPKQFHALAGARTLLQETALRVADPTRFERLIVVANAEHRFIVAEQLRSAARDALIVLEPVARNTAAAVAVAAFLARRSDPDALMLVLPADHALPDGEAFLRSVEAGLPAAQEGRLVLFGVPPTDPATGYGYIQAGEPMAGPARRVEAFVEKPGRKTAEACLRDPDCFWNSGIFLLRAGSALEALARHAPGVTAAVERALEGQVPDPDFQRLDTTAYAAAPAISFDCAVLEHTSCAAMVAAEFAWGDIGSWTALWDLAEPDRDGNVVVGDVVTERTSRSYIRSEGPLVATVGVDDLVVVAMPDAVLVARKGADQEVRKLVARLQCADHRAATEARRVHRPWGWYETLHLAGRCQVKHLVVHPGACLSLQKHFHRAEHWVVAGGTAEVHVDGAQRLVPENGYVHVPLGAQHRLANPGRVPLSLVEVQLGAYLGEDDIVRFEDVYARA